MKSEIEKKKYAGGRPKKIVKRDVITGVRYTKDEYKFLKAQAARAGIKLTSYIRKISLQGTVKERMSDEERQLLRDLRGLTNNINQLTKMAHLERVATAYVYFLAYGEKFDKFLNSIISIAL